VRLEPNQQGFNRPSSPVRPLTEAPQLMDMTLASFLLLTLVNTSGPSWHMSALLIVSLRCPTFRRYNVNQLQKPHISHQYTYIYVYIHPTPHPHVRIHSRGTREVRRAAGCYHWSQVIRLIHAQWSLYCAMVERRCKWARVTIENRTQDYNLKRLSKVE
jgi:hypothetical protein